ncbi:MAG: 2-hydroxyacyl-CoA dehydratase, partial [Proteobacteria bacterium]|nr:2-hydroxyacyl-CoA dehydratase [Pseudomonadota bacterium]
ALQKRAAALMEHAREEQRFVMVVSGRPYHSDPLINHGLPELLAGFGVDVIPENAVPLAADGSLKESSVLTQWAYTNRILSVAKAVAHTPHLEMLQITSFGCGLDAISADEVREIIQGEGKIYSLIKMDEITNLGAVRVRLRSMLEAIRERSRTGKPTSRQGRGDHPSGQNSEGRTILIPWFSPLYSPFIPAVFASFGCRVELLAPQDRSSVDVGLRYVNNDMCYPAVILIGDIIKAFQSRKHDPEKTTVLLIQTFGQCRASNYLPLTRKALASAGFGSVPVISLSAEETSRATSLANQAGEGWLLPAEMIALLKGGVANIVCLQPFGCLANHIIGKGVEKKLKFLYKRLNLLFLDMDPGMSEVNILNRLHFIVMSAREGMQDEVRRSLPLPLIPSRQGRGILGFSPFKGEAGGDGIV